MSRFPNKIIEYKIKNKEKQIEEKIPESTAKKVKLYEYLKPSEIKNLILEKQKNS